MEQDYWLERWRENQIGFHENAPNSLLTSHFHSLSLPEGSQIFVPLCGKTRDMHWLRAQGFGVIGAELSPLAVEQFFAEAGLSPERFSLGKLTRFTAVGVTLYLGDIFELDPATLGPVGGIYDRAALVAFPPEMRQRYATHLQALTGTAPQLLITFNYDERQFSGPPFAVPEPVIRGLYQGSYRITELQRRDIPGGLQGRCPATESAWLLQPHV